MKRKKNLKKTFWILKKNLWKHIKKEKKKKLLLEVKK
jgi:hypothetical protein